MSNKIKTFITAWVVIFLVNQIVIFGACFAPYCIIAALPHTIIIALVITWLLFRDTKIEVGKEIPSATQKAVAKKPSIKNELKVEDAIQPASDKSEKSKLDPLKMKGDQYEKHIGAQFEAKGDFVIYNGFIRGYEDQGVDIVSISSESKTINLIQCKNWTSMRMTLDHLRKVYSKLDGYDFDFLELSNESINTYRKASAYEKEPQLKLAEIKIDLSKYTIRKTLYLASDKVVELEIGRYLTMISPTIFRFEDMKIVINKI